MDRMHKGAVILLEKYWFLSPLKEKGIKCNPKYLRILDELFSELELMIEVKYPKFKEPDSRFFVTRITDSTGSLDVETNFFNPQIEDLIDTYMERARLM